MPAVHIILLGTIVSGSIYILYTTKMPFAFSDYSESAAIAVFAAGFSVMASVHWCDQGNPLQQWLIPSAAIFMVLPRLTNSLQKWIMTLFLVSTAIGLSFHYGEIVHKPQWIGKSPSEHRDSQYSWHFILTGIYNASDHENQNKTQPLP